MDRRKIVKILMCSPFALLFGFIPMTLGEATDLAVAENRIVSFRLKNGNYELCKLIHSSNHNWRKCDYCSEDIESTLIHVIPESRSIREIQPNRMRKNGYPYW